MKLPVPVLLRPCLLLIAISVCILPAAFAQNTGGVFGPVVKEGERSVQYRLSIVPAEGGKDTRHAHRLHGAIALDSRRQVRVIMQGSDRGTPEGFDFDYLQAELLWELSPDNATDWNTGLRFDARINDGDRPDQFGINWTNQFRLTDRLQARAVALTTVQLGDKAADGVLLSARASLAYTFDGGLNLALESYNTLGSTEDFGVNGRSQQLGPTLSGTMPGGWSWTVGNLFGLNDATPDNDIRLWLGRRF